MGKQTSGAMMGEERDVNLEDRRAFQQLVSRLVARRWLREQIAAVAQNVEKGDNTAELRPKVPELSGTELPAR